ncbi:unnamed protein product [Clonostachys rosea]|uniref:Uncharacterized protein n=1 Tax=Bionectria ochroleuca TaxID=29856 RepID=A0ABY6U4K7_BIOOC|nr:unnamed protein product [Clonostachys rosea]
MLAPMVKIPELSEGDLPGLIPYSLPDGMPKTLPGFPLPGGLPDPSADAWVDWEAYETMMQPKQNNLSRLASSLVKSFRQTKLTDDDCQNMLQYNPLLEYLKTFSLSRKIAFSRAIVRTNQVLPANTTSNSSRPVFHPLKHGALSSNIFKDMRTGRNCFAFALGNDRSAESLESLMLQKVNDPSKQYTFVSAWLADIERCIFGHQLSFSPGQQKLDKARFKQVDWAMWWRPDLGARARRPEANHPFFIPPETILSIYCAILHRLIGDYSHTTRNCSAEHEYGDAMYCSGEWYFRLLETGKCSRCGKSVLDDLRHNFPQLLDEDGHIDILILLERGAFEKPELTMDARSHELYV